MATREQTTEKVSFPLAEDDYREISKLLEGKKTEDLKNGSCLRAFTEPIGYGLTMTLEVIAGDPTPHVEALLFRGNGQVAANKGPLNDLETTLTFDLDERVLEVRFEILADRIEIQYKAPRANFESEPVAFMRFEARPSIDFESALKKAVARYVQKTEDGRRLYRYAPMDLNIGDLLSHGAFQDGRFQKYLRDEGIFDLEVWTAEYGPCRQHSGGRARRGFIEAGQGWNV